MWKHVELSYDLLMIVQTLLHSGFFIIDIEIKISCKNGFMENCNNLIKVGILLVKKYACS